MYCKYKYVQRFLNCVSRVLKSVQKCIDIFVKYVWKIKQRNEAYLLNCKQFMFAYSVVREMKREGKWSDCDTTKTYNGLHLWKI